MGSIYMSLISNKVNPIDLGKKGKLRIPKVALVQFKVNERDDYKLFENRIYSFNENKISELKSRIIGQLVKCKEKGADIVAFPEISVPIAAVDDIREYCNKNSLYFIGGLEYDEQFRNSSCVVIPGRDTEYRSAKMNASKYDHKNMHRGKYVNCYVNTGFGDFSVLVCFDFTSTSLLAEISGYVDMLFVIAYNPDSNGFVEQAASKSRECSCYFLITNTAKFGRTCYYAPKIKDNKLERKKIMGKGEKILFEYIDVPKLRENIRDKKGIYADFQRKRFSPPNDFPQNPPRYTLVDWPRPFSNNCIIVIGDTRDRALTDFIVGDDVLKDLKENMKRTDFYQYQTFYKSVERYREKDGKYFQAKTIDAVLLPRLLSEIVYDKKLGTMPDLFLDTVLIANNQHLKILEEYNIISIGGPTVNVVSDKINDELKKDDRIYCDRSNGKMYAGKIYEKIQYGGLLKEKELYNKGFIGVTRNPWNKKKVAMMVVGHRSAGTISSLIHLIKAKNNGFPCKFRYGQIISASSKADILIKSFYKGSYRDGLFDYQ